MDAVALNVTNVLIAVLIIESASCVVLVCADRGASSSAPEELNDVSGSTPLDPVGTELMPTSPVDDDEDSPVSSVPVLLLSAVEVDPLLLLSAVEVDPVLLLSAVEVDPVLLLSAVEVKELPLLLRECPVEDRKAEELPSALLLLLLLLLLRLLLLL
jgi:hypothetical protein